MSANMERRNSDADLFDRPPSEEVEVVSVTPDLLNPTTEAVVTPVPSSDLVERINDANLITGDDTVTLVTDDNFVTSGDIAGEDVVDFGMSSDAGLGGLGVNIDDLPGDETPISR